MDKIIEKCRPVESDNPKEPVEGDETQQIELNVFKFDCYKVCLDRVLAEYRDDDDQDVAAFTSKSDSPGFAIAFNTLEKNEILTKND